MFSPSTVTLHNKTKFANCAQPAVIIDAKVEKLPTICAGVSNIVNGKYGELEHENGTKSPIMELKPLT